MTMSFDKQGNITNDLFESSLRQNQLFRIYPNLPRFLIHFSVEIKIQRGDYPRVLNQSARAISERWTRNLLFILGTSILAKQNYIFVHRNFNSQQGVWVVASNFYSRHHFHHVRRCRIRFCLKTTTSRTSSQFIWVAIITHTAAVQSCVT